MKSFTASALSAALLASEVAAFPHFAMDAITAPLVRDAASSASRLERRQVGAGPQGTGFLPLTPPPFNAKAQYVSTSGQYAFVPPGPTDARGECPGLNAMANHGYLPHNGVATIQQFIDATTSVFGMGEDLAAFLAIYGAVIDGDLTSWSISGGPHIGIGGSHGDYESDSSPLKGDLYQYGSNEKLIMSQFYELYNMQPNASTANYNLDVIRNFRETRFKESIAKNPYFTYGVFDGMVVSQAAFTFIYRFMANHTAEVPEGYLDKEVLKSFMSITGPENNLKWTKGHERIPDNWYRRDFTIDSYTIPYFLADVLAFAELNPEFILVGCNSGKVNTYQTISATEISNGAYTAQQAAANPVCFATEFLKTELGPLTGLSTTALAPLTSVLTNVTSSLGCASIGSVNMTAIAACPGFTFYGGPTAPVAPGAIQS